MENKPFQWCNFWLFIQLICFVMAVGLNAGGGETPDKIGGYNQFFYFKAIFLSLPILTGGFLFSRSFFQFFYAMILVLKSHRGLLVYFIFAFLSLIFAYDFSFSFGRLVYTAGAVVSLWCLMAQYIRADSQRLFYRHLLTVFICVAIGIPLMVLCHGGLDAIYNLRAGIHATGVIHPNTVASVCAYGLFHMLFYPARDWQLNGVEKIARIFIGVAMPVIMVMIFSRSVMLSMVLALIGASVFGFIWFGSYRALIGVLCVLSGAVISALLLYLGGVPVDGVLQLISRTGDGVDLLTLTHRTQLWHRLIEQIDFKIFMVGNGYGVMTPDYGVDFGTGVLYGAHNIYLSILLGTGIFSLIAFLTYLLGIFVDLCKNHHALGARVSLHGIALLAFFMTHSMTSTEFSLNLGISFALVMMMAGVVFCTPRGHS